MFTVDAAIIAPTVALLLAIAGGVYAFGRLSNQVQALGQRIEAVDKRFDAVEKRFDTVDRRFGDLDRRFDDLDRRFGDLDRRFGDLDRRFGDFDRQMTNRMDRMETSIEQLRQGQMEILIALNTHLAVHQALGQVAAVVEPVERPMPTG